MQGVVDSLFLRLRAIKSWTQLKLVETAPF